MGFFEHQLDFVFLLDSLSLLLVTMVCMQLRRQRADTVPWQWLAGYTLARGIHQSCHLLALILPGFESLGIARAVLAAVAFIFIAEFARAMVKPSSRHTGRWIVLGIAFLPAFAGIKGILWTENGFEYLSAVAGMLAAWGLYCRTHPADQRSRLPGLSECLLAVCVISDVFTCEAAFWPTSVINDAAFTEFLGLPIQAVQCVLLVAWAMTLRGWARQKEHNEFDHADQPINQRWLGPAVALVLGCGFLAAEWAGRGSEESMRESLLARTRLAVVALDMQAVEELTGTRADIDTPAYESIRSSLARLRHANADCRFVYLLARSPDGCVRYLADSEPTDSPDHSPAGQIYEEANATLIHSFEHLQPGIDGPDTERSGTWVTGLVPIREHGSGRLITVLGMDVDGGYWNRQITLNRLPVIGVSLLITVLLVGFAATQRRSHEAGFRLAASEAIHRNLVESSPNQVVLLDANGRCLTVNQNGLDKLGLSQGQVVGKLWRSLWPQSSQPTIDAAIEHVCRGERTSFEADYIRPDGGFLVWQVVLSSMLIGQPGVRRFVAIGIDITHHRREERRQRRRLRRLQDQHAVTVQLSTDRNLAGSGLNPLVARITELTAHAMQIERASVWLLDADRQQLRCLDLFESTAETHEHGQQLAMKDYPHYFQALELGQTIDASDASKDPRTSEFTAAYLVPLGIVSMLDVAIRVGGMVVGVVCFEHVGLPRRWEEDEITFAGMIADQIAKAITMEERRQADAAVQESEARLKIIVNAIQAGLVVIDAETHTVVDANPAAMQMIGRKREEIVNGICHSFICPAELGKCPVTDLGMDVDNSERVLVRADGSLLPILKTVVPIMLNGRQHLLESFVDISHRKQIESELAAHRERLEELVSERTARLVEAERQMLQGEKLASIGRLAAGVAHEINTPIQYVGDNLRALADFYKDIKDITEQYRELVGLLAKDEHAPALVQQILAAEQECDLDYILNDVPNAVSQGLEGVDRVAKIVRAMKDFSHMKAGNAAPTDLNQALQSTLTVARNEYKYVADVETNFGELPAVECCASELNQVFLNLLVNAAHAIADTQNRGKITITTHADDEGVEIAISDTGTGIPESVQAHMYEPFFTTKEVGRGTGQGLYIAQQIVVGRHGGTMICESKVGEGTTFRIRLPLHMPVVEEPAAPAPDASL